MELGVSQAQMALIKFYKPRSSSLELLATYRGRVHGFDVPSELFGGFEEQAFACRLLGMEIIDLEGSNADLSIMQAARGVSPLPF